MSDLQPKENLLADLVLPEKKKAPKQHRPKQSPEEFQARNNLKLLSEVYRNHWEIFLKGFGLYLAACSALTGVSAYQASNKPLSMSDP